MLVAIFIALTLCVVIAGMAMQWRDRTIRVEGSDELAKRLLANEGMAKTFPLALHGGESVEIDHDALRVVRRCVDSVPRDALQSAWALASAVITALDLQPPSAVAPAAPR